MKGGNTSQTFIEKVDGVELFIKRKPVQGFDTRVLAFQSRVRQIISGSFNVNKFENVGVKASGPNNDLFYEMKFEKLDEKEWAPNEDNMKIIGTSMAIIHNYCFLNADSISLNEKEEKYDASTMQKWLEIDQETPFLAESFEQRKDIFKSINRLNQSQPKIALHRDFRPHNILFDGENYHLIDFDFAAIDYVSLEVMGFISDIIETGMSNVKAFLEGYFSNINIPIIPESFVDDYLNYLCTNTFPFYLHENLEPANYRNLVEHRNNALNSLYNNRENIQYLIKNMTEL